MNEEPELEGQVDSGEQSAFAAMFDTHAAHLYDYCKELLGDQAEAASATEAALIAARSVLQDPDRLRAWLFALARGECLTISPGQLDEYGNGLPPGADPDDEYEYEDDEYDEDDDYEDEEYDDYDDRGGRRDVDEANTDELNASDVARFGTPAPTIVSALTGREREVLDLVYRHGIRPDHLPAVLGMAPDQALALLAGAEAEFSETAAINVADEESGPAEAGYGPADLEQIAAAPLASLPPWVRQHAFDAVFGGASEHSSYGQPATEPDRDSAAGLELSAEGSHYRESESGLHPDTGPDWGDDRDSAAVPSLRQPSFFAGAAALAEGSSFSEPDDLRSRPRLFDDDQLGQAPPESLDRARKRLQVAGVVALPAAAAAAAIFYLAGPSLHHAHNESLPSPTASSTPSPTASVAHSSQPAVHHSKSKGKHSRKSAKKHGQSGPVGGVPPVTNPQPGTSRSSHPSPLPSITGPKPTSTSIKPPPSSSPAPSSSSSTSPATTTPSPSGSSPVSSAGPAPTPSATASAPLVSNVVRDLLRVLG